MSVIEAEIHFDKKKLNLCGQQRGLAPNAKVYTRPNCDIDNSNTRTDHILLGSKMRSNLAILQSGFTQHAN